MTHADRAAILRELASMLCTSHCWRDHRHVDVPFGEVQLNEHLAGAHKYGLCPIEPGGSTCRVAVLDLDSHKGEVTWDAMLAHARGLAFALAERGLEPQLWRSSGGQGVHLIVAWPEPQDAYTVRETMREVLAECGLSSGTGGVVAGEAEIFPKQDSVPEDGCGNMFVLPFAGKSERIE